jgi:hypothetical protein
MRSSNILRASLFSIGAIFLIFSQDHSVEVGMNVLKFVAAALAFGGIILFRTAKTKTAFKDYAVPSAISFVIALMTIAFGGQYEGEVTDELFAFRSIVFLFVVAIAIYELAISRKAHPDDVLELRISAGLGALTGVVFAFAPLDELNSVGFLSAYLALSAVQRAVWAATPTNRKKSNNGN